jgi:FMN phosphatase YigB (HAD superfamily)
VRHIKAIGFDLFDTLVTVDRLGLQEAQGRLKPHWRTFHTLGEQLGLPREQIAYVGDDQDNDVNGARQAGLQPIWTTHARAHKPAQTTASTLWTAADADPTVPTVASWRELLTLFAGA